MKILHLTTHLNRGGISQYILLVGSTLKPKGHEIFVASSGGEMEKEFEQKGIRVRNFSIRTKNELSPKLYQALPALIRWIRQEKIQILHAHTRITQVMAAWIERFTGIPFVTTAHGFYTPRLGRRLLPAWGKRVVAISDPVADSLHDIFWVSRDKIRVVYNGIDIDGFIRRFKSHTLEEARKSWNIPQQAYVTGITARLVPEKGHEYLVRALKVLESEMPDLYVLIVGDGRHRGALENLVKKLALEKRVVFTGNLEDVSHALAAMDVFVLPAVWREGFGLSIAEAMACGKPVIATNIWALNALVHHGVNGLLVEPRNVDSLVSALRLVRLDPVLRQRIAKEGQRTAHESFTVDRMAQELEVVYEEALKG